MAKESKLKDLLTRWGEQIDKNCPLSEYPRPQLKRNNWVCLNGLWEYAIEKEDSSLEPDSYDGSILVPFSPECLLSGVKRQLLAGQTLWYRREVSFEQPAHGLRLLLHFGAVDQRCQVYVNGQKAGSHSGGYWPFYFDITDLLNTTSNVISVAVWDDSDSGIEAYGKQRVDRDTIWYTPQSGIWQTVWAETVPEQHIESIKITPRCESSEVEFSIAFSKTFTTPASAPPTPASASAPVPASAPAPASTPAPIKISIFHGDRLVSEGSFETGICLLPLPDFRYWHPDDPFLYTVKITAGNDEIESYFGMRQFGIIKDGNGHPRLSLNGEIIFHSGLLDQGYWSDGMYTPASDEAMIWDISETKKFGFNMLRKHIKIEPLRWYYHCDRLGMLVWQDFVSGGGPYGEFVTRYLPFIGIHLRDDKNSSGFGRSNQEGRAVFGRDMARTVDLLYNVVSLSVWVPFNEGWGQFDAARICEELRAMDSTRAIDHASGWHDRHAGDFASYHIYYKPFRMKPDKHGRIKALTEFGGYSCPSEGHMASDKQFGYRIYKDKQELNNAIEELYSKEVIPKIDRGLAASIYTQVSDVEEEINGFFTYDRAEVKIDAEIMKRVNDRLIQTEKQNS